MAATLVSVRPIGLHARATGGHHKRYWKSPSPSNWWAPLFGWSSKPDYFDLGDRLKLDADAQSAGSDQDPKVLTRSRSRSAPGTFTEEKARRLRLMTSDTGAFHGGAMYHSAIASRLASEFSDPSEILE